MGREHRPAPTGVRPRHHATVSGTRLGQKHPERFEELLAARLEYPTPPEAWQAQRDACSRFLLDGVPPGPIDQPTWVVHGTLDRVVPLENAAAIKRRIPQATVTELPGRLVATSAGSNARTRSTR